VIPPLIHPHLEKLSSWIAKVEFFISKQKQMGTSSSSSSSDQFKILLTCCLQFINRFFLLFWFVFVSKDLFKIRLFLASMIAFEHVSLLASALSRPLCDILSCSFKNISNNNISPLSRPLLISSPTPLTVSSLTRILSYKR
jgi:hypothetical protein